MGYKLQQQRSFHSICISNILSGKDMLVKSSAVTSITLAIAAVVNAAAITPLQRLEARQQGNGLTDAVTYDNHTIFVKGERQFLFSGEFHASEQA